ncbi:cytochrome b/b6 domain-containing protein [Halodesulfovibrio spirochaetisodalis]|uniref:Cytochrome B561 n=1 Tax=Halodesulfovibrio spirochaetisodalis TaxID=1560234 RepID=A0A1B7X9J8_9BACT|nr:cytochrome b/b6 domain-containing protein [Halodesulfovibrio spirochaetisodalis]OBQ46012.1 cytochrome B561 [Halodesulfovibrio spirochaetisodalis]
MSSTKLYLYTRFERFWHWAQAALIIALLVTGFEIHGSFVLLGFGSAVTVHNFCAWTWLVLYAFIVFWILTTGEWRHYVPTFVKMFEVMQYYASGIFKGEPHPVPKSERIKHNPLQRITYLGIVSVLVPFQIVTGFMYYLYNDWAAFGWAFTLSTIAILHTIGAFAMLVFSIVHIYMTTTGHHPFSHIKAMFTGYEELEPEK